MAIIENGPILVIVVVIILLFGATQIPKLARSLGRAKGEFSKAKGQFESEAAAAEHGVAGRASEAKVRETARSLGIEEKGKSLDEVKRLLQEKFA